MCGGGGAARGKGKLCHCGAAAGGMRAASGPLPMPSGICDADILVTAPLVHYANVHHPVTGQR